MKKRLFKIVLAVLFVFSFTALITFAFNTNVYAEEIVDNLDNEETTPSDEEVQENEEGTNETPVEITQEEKSKIDTLVEWVSSLNKDELFQVLENVKAWLIAGGIITVMSYLAAIIGLIAAILKLQREKVKNSDKEEKQKQAELETIDNFTNALKEGNTQIKNLLLDFVTNLSDKDKKAVEANIEDVRTKIQEALAESTTNTNN